MAFLKFFFLTNTKLKQNLNEKFMLKAIIIKKNTFFFIIILIPLFLISAFRDGLGTDYYSYANLYKYPDTYKDEFLFKFFFISLPRLICENELFFFILTSLTICFFFIKSIFVNSQIIFLSVFIFITQFYFISFNAIRQFIVISIFLYYGFKLFKEKNILFYICLIVLLAQIHFSIYIMLLFPIIGNKKFKLKSYWITWIIVFLIFELQFIDFISFSNIFQYIPGLSILSSKFDTLQAGSEFFFGKYQSNNQLIVKNLFFILFLTRFKYFGNKNDFYWFNLYLFGLVLQNILVKFSLFAVRIAYFGDIAVLFLIPIFINSFSNKTTRLILLILFILFYFTSFYTRFIINGESEVFKQGVEWMQ